MHVLLAPVAFKGSLSAAEVARALEVGLRRAVPDAEIEALPLADGGEGTLDALLAVDAGEVRQVRAHHAYGEPVVARFGLFDGERRAVVESAEAIGLALLGDHPLDPFAATSRGLGEVLAAALDAGAEELWVGLGGSATVDGGAGMLAALGARLADDEGHLLEGDGAALARISVVDLEGLHPRLNEVRVQVLADVTSPLLGPRGARLYMAQKGASDEDAALLEAGLARFADVVEAAAGRRARDLPSAGAAGGLGFALLALGAEAVSGADAVLAAVGVDDAIARADLVLTGEGRIDEQTAEGKLIAVLARRCRAQDKPLVALCGARRGDLGPVYEAGVTAVVPIAGGPATLEEMMERAGEWLADAAEMVGRLTRGAV